MNATIERFSDVTNDQNYIFGQQTELQNSVDQAQKAQDYQSFLSSGSAHGYESPDVVLQLLPRLLEEQLAPTIARGCFGRISSW